MANNIYKFVLACVISCAVVPAFAQYVITGKVVSDENDQPLPGASVYINSSTIGTTSNENGEFTLPAVSNGFYDVVASYVGYEILVYRANIQSSNLRITFRLVKKHTELRNIVITTNLARARWLKIFRENFLGISFPSRNCRIVNEDEIMFQEGTGDNIVKAFTAAPLEIVNPDLGYRIFFQLEDFYFSSYPAQTYFYGYSRFEELSDKKEIPERFVRNRKRYYLGSTLHFFHSLIDSRVKDEGFSLLNIRPVPKDTTSRRDTLAGARPKRAPGAYIRNDMQVAVPIAADKVFRRDSTGEGYLLDFEGRLRVTYNIDPYGKKFLQQKVFLAGNMPRGVFSDIEMLVRPAGMDRNGCLENPLAIQMSGYWSYEKLANMLPLDYRPPKN
jgi:hypothetical protein